MPERQSNWLPLLFLYLFLHFTPLVQYREPGRVAGIAAEVAAAAPGVRTPLPCIGTLSVLWLHCL